MHNYSELVYRSTLFSLQALDEVESKATKELEKSGSTNSVKALQMIQLQKSIIAIGMFSLFESILQDELACAHGFKEAKKILLEAGEKDLNDRFQLFFLAINVLKHGHGKSYDTLIAEPVELPFRIKKPGEDFFYEGDVSEVNTLIEVDNQFVGNCAEVIESVSKVLRKVRNDFYC